MSVEQKVAAALVYRVKSRALSRLREHVTNLVTTELEGLIQSVIWDELKNLELDVDPATFQISMNYKGEEQP